MINTPHPVGILYIKRIVTTICLLWLSTMSITCGDNMPADGDAGRPDTSVPDLPPLPDSSVKEDAHPLDDLGTADASPTGCSKCHGGPTGPAPPLSATGKSATSERGVGAHASHLKTSTWRSAVPCSACHVVPKKLLDTGHIDTALPAEVTFSALAKADSASPSWTGTQCSGSYCHGATLSGGSNTSPLWTTVNGTQAACGSCHGLPPTKDHTPNKQCSMCHKGVVDSSGKIVDVKKHINGKTDFL